MCFFRRKKGYAKMQESHEEVVDNVRNLEATMAYTKSEAVIKEMEEVLRLLKYEVGPSKEKDANKIDKKIANKIGDLKIVLAKGKEDSDKKALDILAEIKVDVKERQVYSK